VRITVRIDGERGEYSHITPSTIDGNVVPASSVLPSILEGVVRVVAVADVRVTVRVEGERGKPAYVASTIDGNVVPASSVLPSILEVSTAAVTDMWIAARVEGDRCTLCSATVDRGVVPA